MSVDRKEGHKAASNLSVVKLKQEAEVSVYVSLTLMLLLCVSLSPPQLAPPLPPSFLGFVLFMTSSEISTFPAPLSGTINQALIRTADRRGERNGKSERGLTVA